MKPANDVSSGPSFGHDDPVFAKEICVRLMHVYEVRPRKGKRGTDLISDALPFGRLC